MLQLKNKKIHHETTCFSHADESWWIKFLAGLAKNSIYFYFLFNTIGKNIKIHYVYSSNRLFETAT